MEKGSIIRDRITGELVVLVEDRGDRYVVASTASLKPGASLIERAQRVLPAADFEAAQ